MTVIKMTRLEIVPSSLTLLASGDATVPDYEAGFKTAGSLGLTAYTNNGTGGTPGASVTMAAATTNFAYSGTASPTPTKAASTLQWSINSGGSWNNTTTAGGTVLTAAGATAGTTQNVIFRTGLSWAADPPGTYTLTLNFTITAP
jgi:cytochrome c1